MADLPRTADVVVVGGGVHGASVAYHLARRRAGRVVLVERKFLASGPTGRSSALVRRFYAMDFLTRTGERLRAAIPAVGRRDRRRRSGLPSGRNPLARRGADRAANLTGERPAGARARRAGRPADPRGAEGARARDRRRTTWPWRRTSRSPATRTPPRRRTRSPRAPVSSARPSSSTFRSRPFSWPASRVTGVRTAAAARSRRRPWSSARGSGRRRCSRRSASPCRSRRRATRCASSGARPASTAHPGMIDRPSRHVHAARDREPDDRRPLRLPARWSTPTSTTRAPTPRRSCGTPS